MVPVLFDLSVLDISVLDLSVFDLVESYLSEDPLLRVRSSEERLGDGFDESLESSAGGWSSPKLPPRLLPPDVVALASCAVSCQPIVPLRMPVMAASERVTLMSCGQRVCCDRLSMSD